MTSSASVFVEDAQLRQKEANVDHRQLRTVGDGFIARIKAGAHIVQFYDGEDFLCQTVCEYAAGGLGSGDPVVIIATKSHLRAFTERLEANSINTTRALVRGQLTLLDAEDTLSLISNENDIDWARLKTYVGGLIEKLRRLHDERPVRVFGEIVDLLWKEGKRQTAIRLERFWNELAKLESFSLLCGYSLDNFPSADDSSDHRQICGIHSHTFPTENLPRIDSGDAGLLTVSILQQRARALELELLRRKELERNLREREAELQDLLESRKRAELVLASSLCAEAASQAKNEFLAVVSHDGGSKIASHPELENVHVLVVDDEEDARELVAVLLSSCKVRVSTAGSVDEAMRVVSDARPDIIVSDIGMPDEDGYALIRRLRGLPPGKGGTTPAIALTAYARAEERTRALISGFSMHLPKPVEPNELLEVLSNLTTVIRRH